MILEISICIILVIILGVIYRINYYKGEANFAEREALLLKELDKFLKEVLKDDDTETVRQVKIKKFMMTHNLDGDFYNRLVYLYEKSFF